MISFSLSDISDFLTMHWLWFSILLTILPILVPIMKKKYERRSKSIKISKNLCNELEDTLKEFKKDTRKQITLMNGNNMLFVKRKFNHDVYDSLISSGSISILKPELNQPIQNVYQKIKSHNDAIEKILEIEDRATSEENIILKTDRYYEHIQSLENDMESDIEDLIKELE